MTFKILEWVKMLKKGNIWKCFLIGMLKFQNKKKEWMQWNNSIIHLIIKIKMPHFGRINRMQNGMRKRRNGKWIIIKVN